MVYVGRHPVRSEARVAPPGAVPKRRRRMSGGFLTVVHCGGLVIAACAASALVGSPAFAGSVPVAGSIPVAGSAVAGSLPTAGSAVPRPTPSATPPVADPAPANDDHSTPTPAAQSIAPPDTATPRSDPDPTPGPLVPGSNTPDPRQESDREIGERPDHGSRNADELSRIPTRSELSGRIPAPTQPALAVTGGPSRPAGSSASAPARPGSDAIGDPDPRDARRAPAAGSEPSASSLPETSGSPAALSQGDDDRWNFMHSAATGQRLFLSGFLLLLLSIGGLVTVGIYRRRW